MQLLLTRFFSVGVSKCHVLVCLGQAVMVNERLRPSARSGAEQTFSYVESGAANMDAYTDLALVVYYSVLM